MTSNQSAPDRYSEEWDRTKEALAWEASVNAAMAELARALISNSMTIEDISYRVLKHTKQLTGSQFGYVGYIDPQTGHLVCPTMTRDIWDACDVPDKSIVFETFSGLWGWVLENRQPLLTNAPLDDPRSSGVPEGHLPIRRFLSAPALVGTSLVGQIALANAADDYVRQDLNVVERLASLYALAVQRKQAETALQESEEKYRTLVEQSLQGVIIAQADPVRLSFANRSMETLCGFPPDELLAMEPRQLAALIHPEDREIFFQNFQDRVAGKEVAPQREYRFVHRDGDIRWVLSHSSRIEYEGAPATLTVFVDITERKRAEHALRQAEQRLDKMLQTMVDGMVVVDLEGQITYANQSAERILEIYRDEIVGRYYNEREWRQIDEEGNPYPLAQLPLAVALREGREVQDLEHGILAPDGTAKWLSVNAAPLLDEQGQIYGAVASFRDTTERKQAEELLVRQAEELARSNAELEQFAYIASHDLQEPLRTVSSYVQLLGRRYGEQLDAEAQEYITFAVDGIARMQDLIRDLLEYSRVDRLGQTPEPTDSEFVVGLVLDNLQMTIEEAGATVTHDPLPTVMADSTQLGQVFQNLISNALKFRGKEPPRVHISAKTTATEWLFSVCDNGIGIEPQFQEKIFDVFGRLHTRDEYPGTGIGLALCTKIVERHGGRIWVDSQPGQGSTFWFSISRKGKAPHAAKSGP